MRLAAKPGDSCYCRLSANTQLLARVDHLLKVRCTPCQPCVGPHFSSMPDTVSLLCCLQVGRNNFRPPPKVDSSVVRIEPRNPLPNVNFKEWDGLGRLCFSRKNKTLGAIFRQKSVVQLVEKNVKTFQALKDAGVVMQGGGDVMMMAEGGGENEEMDLDGTAAVDTAADSMEVEGSGDKGKEASVYKEKALQVLKSGGFEDKRSSKLTQDDFLRLLSLFNEAGIHFA